MSKHDIATIIFYLICPYTHSSIRQLTSYFFVFIPFVLFITISTEYYGKIAAFNVLILSIVLKRESYELNVAAVP